VLFCISFLGLTFFVEDLAFLAQLQIGISKSLGFMGLL